jgi:iron complex outermembrane receptor protein
MKHSLSQKALPALIAGVLGMVALSSAAQAQDDAAVLEEVIVTGMRANLIESLDQKREANQVKDVVTAEDIGKMPDQNIADVLMRIPGVSVMQGMGEGEAVSVRGTSPSLNKITLNGQVLSNPGGERDFNLNLMSSQLVSALEVLKSPTAEMVEGSIGGTVNLKTRNPLDFKDVTTTISAQAVFEENSDELEPNISALIGAPISDSFGVLFDVTWDKRNAQRHSIQTGGYRVASGSSPEDYIYYPFAVRPSIRAEERDRLGMNATLQFRPSDNWDLKLKGFYSELDRAQEVYNLQATVNKKALDVIEDNRAVTGAINKMRISGFNRLYDDSTWMVDFVADWFKGDWNAHFDIGTSEAEGFTNDLNTIYEAGASGTFDFARPLNPAFTTNTGYTVDDDLTKYQVTQIRLRHDRAEDTSDFAQADVVFDMNDSGFTQFKFGARYSDTRRDVTSLQTQWSKKSSEIAGTTLDDVYTSLRLHNSASTTSAYDWAVADYGLVRDTYDEQLIAGFQPRTDFNYDVAEQVGAAYIQFEYESEWFGKPARGNIGLRYVDTDVTSKAVGSIDGVEQPFTVKNSYDDWLPSLNLALVFAEDVLLRASAAQVMARPKLSDLRASFDVRYGDGGENTIRGGNPYLDPYRATQYNLSLEWYLAEGSLLSGGVYYNDIDSYIYKRRAGQEGPPVQLPDFGDAEWVLITPENLQGGSVKGYELVYQQLLDNFIPGIGFSLNYTYADANSPLMAELTDEKLPLPEVSEHTANAILFYEGEHFEARLAYTYRSEFLLDAGVNTKNNKTEPRYTADFDQFDLRLGYSFNKTWAMNLDVVNLTDEDTYDYNSEQDRLYWRLQNGRRYYLGVKARF